MTSPHPSPNIVITSFIRVDGERQARYAAEETFRKVQAEYSELRGVIDDINGQIDASRERLRLIKYEHNEEKRHLQSRLGDDAGSDRSGGSYTHYSRDLYSYRRRDTHSREHHDYDSSANKRRLFEMMASVEMEVSELQRVRREIVRQQELVRTLHIDIHTLQFREDELRKVANDTDKRHGREVDIRDNVVTKLQQEVATATDQLLQQKFQNQQLLDDAMLLDAQLKTYRRLWDLSEGRDPPGDLFPPVRDDEETTLGTSGRRPLALPAPPSMPAGRTWGALTKMDTTVTPGYAPPPIKRDYGITTRTGASTTRISYVTSAAARKTTSRTSTDQDDAPGGKFAKIEVRGQTTRKDTTPTLTATQTIRIGPPKNPGESGFIHQVSRTDQDQVDTSAAVTMETSGGSFSGQSIASQTAGVAYGQVASLVPQVEQQERIMVTVTEGKVTGAKQLKSGQTKELSPIETQQIMASIPAETAQKSGNIMVTVTEGQVVETKAVTEKEAETIVSLVTEEGDPTAEKVVVSVEGGQVVGKRVGKDKATPLSPQEAAQLWRSVAQPGQQTGDVVVSLKQGQIVGSQQLTATEAETIKAVVVEEPKPTVCVTPGQPAFTSIVPTPAQLVAPQKDKIMVTVTNGKVSGAKRLKSGDTKELSPLETQQIMASVPTETAQQSGNIMVTVTEGKVIETKQVTTKEAETIVSLVSEEPDPTAEKVVVSLEAGQVVGKRVGKDKATPLSPQEAAQLWRSVAQPGQQTGDVVVSLKQGQIVGSQQLTPTEAETIKSVVTQEAQAMQVIQTSQQVQPGGSITLQQPGVFGAVQTTQVFSSGVQTGGMVAPGTVAPGTVAPRTEAPGIVAPGTLPFGTVASGTVPLGSVAPGTVAPGIVAPGIVAPGTVAPGTIPLGTVAPGTVAPATQAPGMVAPGTVPFGTVASGTVPLGSVAPGTVAPGIVAAGTVAAGTIPHGSVAPGTVAPGTVAPGTVVPGTVAPGTVTFGTVATGTVAPGTVAFGTVAPGTVAPGAAPLGSVALGTVAPGTVAPGTVAPRTGAPGIVAPGTVPFGTVASGTVPLGSVVPGTVAPGTAAFGTVAPGIVVPGTVAPGTGAIVTGTVTESGSVSTGTVAPGGVAPAPGTTTASAQIQEYLPPFARHPLPPINFGDAPATAGSEMPLSPSSTTVMASIENGNIVRARRLNFGKFEDFSPQEAEQMLSGLPDRQATQSGNVMAMISEGKIIKSQQLSPWVAEQLIATMSGSAPGQVTVPVSGQATYVPAPGSPPVTVPVFGQAKISPTIVEKPVTPVSGEAKFFTGQEPAVVNGQRTPLQGTASQQVAGSSVITQQATVTVSGMTPGFQAAPIQTTPASTVPVHGFHPNIPQVYDETLPTVHTTPHVLPMIPETLPDTSERIVASVSDGKIVGAQKIVNGRTVQVDPIYAESALATAPSQAALQSGTIMMSMVDGKVQDTKPLTPAEAQYVVATATVGDAGQAVPYTTPGLQQFGGSQTSQIVSSSQVNNYQTTTPSIGQQVLQPSEKIMMTIDEGKVVGAVQLKNGESTQIPASEAEKMLAVSGQPGQKSGNVMLTVSEGAVLDTQQVTPREAETIVSTLTAQPDPTAETIMVRFVNGQVVGAEKTFREQASTLSAPEAQMLLSSVPNQPTPQTGNILLIKSEGRIVESQELTSTEADTIMTTVFKKAPQQSLIQQQPQFASVTQTQPAFPSVPIVTQQQDRIVVTVADGKVTGAKDLKTGQQKQLSPIEAQQIMASAPAGTAQQTGNIMVTVTDGKIAESKPVTQREAETIASVVAEQSDPTAEKVVVSVERGQVVGKRVGKDKATPLSSQEAAQLWRSVAQPGQQTGDVVVSLKQGQIVGSQQLTPTEAETIKAVVVEEPKPTVCVFPTPTEQVWPSDPNQPAFTSPEPLWPRDPNQPAFTSIVPTTAQLVAPQKDKIMVTVTDGKVTGAKQLKSGQTKELSSLETQQIMASVPSQTAQQSGNIMVTVTDGKVVETKTVTEKEAETIVSLVTEEADPTAEKVVVSVEGGQVVGKRVGKDKATPLSSQEAAQLWRSVAQPGQQTGDVVVSLKQGQIVGSQQLTPTEAETIKAVVVEEPKPTVCVTPGQPAFSSILPTVPKVAAPQEDKVMVTVTNGKVTGAKQLKSGETKELSPFETQQIMASVPAEAAQKSGNIMVTVTEGKVVDTKPVTEREAETIVSLVTEEADPTAEKVVVSIEEGQVVGKRVGKDKSTPLSPQEAAQLWRSVAQPGQQTGDVVVSLKQGQIVGSQQLTPTEAETIKAVVVEEPKPTVCVTPAQPAFTSVIPTVPEVTAPQEDKIMVTVTNGKVTGAKQLKSGETKELSPFETQQIMASVPAETAQKSGNIMVTVTEGKVVDTKPVTEREAETIVSLVTEEADPTAEKVVVSVEKGQVVGKRVGKDKATPLSPQEAAQLWRSVAQPGQQTGDVVVSLKQGQIVGSQQLTPTEAETIKAVVVEEPKPTVCVTPAQPAFSSVVSAVPKVAEPQEDKIMVTVTDGKVTGAKQLKSGETKELSPFETQQIMASVPAEATQKSGNIMVTVTEGKVVDTKPVTEREAETIVSLVTEEADPTAEKVVVSVEKGQVVGKRVGKDKATPLSPQEAAQLWRSVAQPGQQTGDVVVSLKQGQIVGSQQLTPTEAETIKAVVVEEPKPTVCVTPDQPAFSSVVPTPSTFVSTEPIAAMKPVTSEKIIVNVANGKVSGAKHLRPGDLKDLSPTEAQEILTYVPVQKPGNVILTVADGNVVETKRVTEVEAENIMSLVSEDITPDAEKAIVTLEGGEIVGQRIGKDKTTPLSPREAEELWRSVSHPGQISGDVMVSLSEGKIVKSQQLTPTEAETIKVVVEEKAKPTVKVSSGLDRAPGQDIRGSETLMATIVDGKVVGARKLTDGVTTQVSTAEAEEIISSVPGQSSQTGHVLATISGNEVVEVQQLTPKDAEEITITGTIPRAIGTAPGEKVLLTVAGGRVAEAQKVGLRTLTPLSPTEGQKLLESASSKTKEPGDIAVTIVDGKVVGSRWVSSKLGSTQVDGSVPTGETAVIRKVVMTPSGERVVQEVVAPKDAPASEMALSGDYGKRVKVEVLEGRAAMKEFLAGSSTDSDTDAYMTPRSDQSDAYVSASSDAYVTPPSERSDAYVTPPGEPMDYSGAPEEQDGKSWFAQVTDKVTSAFFSPGTEGDVKVTEGTVPVESSIERSTSAEDIFVDAEQGRPVAAMDVSASAGFDKGPRPLQIGQIREETVVPSVQPGREPTESDEGRPKQRTVSEVARAVIPPVSVKTGEMKTEPQFFGQGEVQETAIRPEHVGTDEPVKTRRTTSDLAEEIIGPLANSASPQKGDVFFTEVPESEEAARKKRTELEYFRQVSLESEDAAEMTPEVLAELKERAAEDDTRKSSRVSFSTGPPEVIGTTEDDEDRRKPIATITMEKTEKTPVGDVKLAPAAKVAGKEPGKPTWNKVWPEKHENLPADVTTMETVEVEEYQLAPGVGRAGVRLQWKIDKTKAVPAFTKKLTTMLAKEGSTFEAAVRVSGDPQPDITWYHHDKPLKPTDKLDIVKDKGYSSLVFMEVLPQHAGLYSCVATNVMGKATSRAPLVITDEMDSELPMPGAVISDEGELEAEGEDEAPALPPRLIDENDDRALPNQLQPAVSAGRGRTDSSSVSSVEPDVPDVNARDAKSAVVKELKEYQATSPIFKTPPFKRSKEELEGGVTMVTPTVDGEKVSPGKVEITTPASKVAGVSVDSKAEVTTPQAEVTTPTGGVGIEAVRLPSGSALPAPVKPEKKKSGLKKMFSGRKKKDKDAKKGTPTSGKAVVTPDTKPAEGEDEVFSPAVTLGAEVKPGEGQKAPSTEETVLTISTTEKKSSLTRGTARPGDLPVAIGEVVWAEPGKGATPKGSAGRTPSAELKTPTGGRTPSGELRTPSTGGRTPSAEELGSPTAVSAEKKKTGWSKFKRTFSVKKKKEKKSSSSSSSIDRIPYEQRQAYASGSLPRSAEKYSELSRSTSATMPVRPISMVSPGERPDLSRASLRTSSSTSSASSNKDKKETRPYSYAGHLDFDPRSPGYHQQRPDLPFVEAEVLPAGGTKAVAGVAASERNGKAEDSDDTETGATLSSKVVASSPSPVLTSSSIVTSSSTFVTSSSKFVSSSTTETVTVSGEEKAGTAGAKLPTSVSAPTGFGAGPASGTGGATLTATVSRTSVATTASRASVALEDSEDSAREATDNFPKYLGGKKKYRKKKGQKQQCKQQ
ncbi:QRICH2 [Branchiostoma lanceolatum]|uniref:QRICH2 protein n=1 Tax=Branchiostoma lanceolatum TaxID=7740 RepID=A0A8K0EKY9_BRALA|nr:QRICH2 [Branchiostoma lanceolatum]